MSRRGSVFALALSALALLMAGLGTRAEATHMTVTAVRGSAYGCYGSVGLFGGPPTVVGPTASVTLPPGGSATPITATSSTCNVAIGPATIFTSGPASVSTQGTTGPTGSVTSTATLGPINTSGNEVFTATRLSSTCTANESGVTGSTTVTGGVLVLRDPNPDVVGEAGEQRVIVPVNPAPNTTYTGVVANVNDEFRAVFNEQIVNPDGSLTVNAYHLYLLGPTARGDVIAGQVVCGVTTQPAPTTTTTRPVTTSTTVAPTTSTTRPATTSTTVAPTTSTTRPVTTSTTVAPTTSTTRPATTSTTVAPTTSTTVAPTTSTTRPATTSTTVASTTSTTVRPTTTTTRPGAACVPGEDGARPGHGYGDKNHEHCGPPGRGGMRPVGSSDTPPSWPLLLGLGVLLISLVVPFRRSIRGDRRIEG